MNSFEIDYLTLSLLDYTNQDSFYRDDFLFDLINDLIVFYSRKKFHFCYQTGDKTFLNS